VAGRELRCLCRSRARRTIKHYGFIYLQVAVKSAHLRFGLDRNLAQRNVNFAFVFASFPQSSGFAHANKDHLARSDAGNFFGRIDTVLRRAPQRFE
jgi:hypothetical protein